MTQVLVTESTTEVLVSDGDTVTATNTQVQIVTAGTQGPQGATGPTGAAGATGPNNISGSTASSLSGFLKAVGGFVAAVTSLGVLDGGTGLTAYAQGDLIYASASNTLAKLGKNATAQRVLTNGGTNNNPIWAQVSLTQGVSGVLPIANGGNNTNSQTSNGIAYFNGSAIVSSGSLAFDGSNLTLATGGDIYLTGGSLRAVSSIFDPSGYAALDVTNHLIYSSVGNLLIDFSGNGYSGNGAAMVFNGSNQAQFSTTITDQSNYSTIDTNSRILYAADGSTQTIDYSQNGNNGSAILSFAYGGAAYINNDLNVANSVSANAYYGSSYTTNYGADYGANYGAWYGSQIGIAYGGTNNTSFTSARLTYFNGTSIVSASQLAYVNSGTGIAHLTITSSAASNKTLVLKGATSQSGNYLEVQNSSSTALSAIESTGTLVGYTLNVPLVQFKGGAAYSGWVGPNITAVTQIGGGVPDLLLDGMDRLRINCSILRITPSTVEWVNGINWSMGSTNVQILVVNDFQVQCGSENRNVIYGGRFIDTVLECWTAGYSINFDAASSQTANITNWRNSSGATLSAMAKNGAFKPASLADSSAENNTIYYSTTASKLVYKDSGGTVNNLY